MLFSQMEPPTGWEEEFEAWYETDHIPARMRLPGFRSAARYRALDGEPWHLAVYHIDDLATLDTDEYRHLKQEPSALTRRMLENARGFTRYTCELVFDSGEPDEEPGCLFVTTFDVPAEMAAEVDAWYEEEHVPMLLDADGWLGVRRYVVHPPYDGPSWTHFALHELRDQSVMAAPERTRARATPRREVLARNPWFEKSGRWLYAPIAHHTAIT